MGTISEAQDKLHDILVNQIAERIPDDNTDWDMEDWTVFALNYLQANIEEALDIKPVSSEETNDRVEHCYVCSKYIGIGDGTITPCGEWVHDIILQGEGETCEDIHLRNCDRCP